ncbi:MAG: PAS domain-containing protein, partial [Myxococcota bacterium]
MLDRFALRLTIRIVFILAGAMLAGAAFFDGRFVVSGTILAVLTAVQVLWLVVDVRRTNLELARFLETAKAGDFSQRFENSRDGAGFEELGRSLSGLMERFRTERADAETEQRYLRAVLDQVPVPLISVTDDGALERLNNAARRMFGMHQVRRLEHLAPLGTELFAAIRDAEPGQRSVVRFGERDRVVVSVSRISASGQSFRLFSLQSLRDELEGAELEAWQQLVRVLTHELMNSLTPIRSLARTSAELLAEPDQSEESVADAHEAVQTVANRADGLLSFVESYRQISRLPKPEKEIIAVGALFARVVSLFSQELDGATLEHQVEPA